MDTEQAFLNEARASFLKDYLPKIEKCMELLSDQDLWWRPHETDNSVGNLLLHLAGNVRQWIISGIGGAPDRRERQQEFNQREPVHGHALLRDLRSALQEADAILAAMQTSEFLKPRVIRNLERTPLQAIFHAVQHFAYHTGQIIYITKLRSGKDLGFLQSRREKRTAPD
ncbi:MAG: DUF1572 family protein [Acidobacteria bacterium]|nr:DUF1572 family protein [Acidobacteriota bacterium]